MKVILICPNQSGGVPALSDLLPANALGLTPFLGEPFLGHWMSHLATQGVQEVRLVTGEDPEMFHEVLGSGSRWGLKIDVRHEVRELTAADARSRHRLPDEDGWPEPPLDVIEADHLPGLPEHKVFASYGALVEALGLWLPRLAASKRLGMREREPGVWIGQRTHLAAGVVLKAPCWIGNHVRVGRDAVVGPNSFLEDRVVLEKNSEVSGSWVAPETFVGVLTQVKDSLAWGSTLISWRSGSHTVVRDSFLMSSLSDGARKEPASNKQSAPATTKLVRPFAPIITLAQKLQG